MDRVWRRVQGAATGGSSLGGGGGGGGDGGRRRVKTACCGCPHQPCQLHVDQRAKRGGGGRKSKGPRTIVCNCQVQPCPVHPVLIRVRRTRQSAAGHGSSSITTNPNRLQCDSQCPDQDLHCSHDRNNTSRGSLSRKINRRCGCAEGACNHHHVLNSGGSIIGLTGSPARRHVLTTSSDTRGSELIETMNSVCDCVDKTTCSGHVSVVGAAATGAGTATGTSTTESGIIPNACSDCAVNPCSHITMNKNRVPSRNSRYSSSHHQQHQCVDCTNNTSTESNNQKSSSCVHKAPNEGRIKRVKCRVRRAGCAMARCTAELAMLHLHWELATECAPCRPRALTRRLCRRQQSDNELYRSNSFKFERFERSREEHATPVKKEISLCDDYSLPVDFVNKRRPVSVAATTSTVQWALPSPTTENVEIEVVEQYSDPRDIRTKSYSDPVEEIPEAKVNYAKINRDYCRPYTDPSASESSCADDEAVGTLTEIRRRKNSLYKTSTTGKSSPRSLLEESTLLAPEGDAVIVDCVALVHLGADQSPTDPNQPVRHPSPYYYGDLFKAGEELARPQPGRYRKSVSLDVPGERSRTPGLPKRNSVAGDGVGTFDKSQELVSPTSGSEQQHAVPPASSSRTEILSSCIITEWDNTLMPPHRLLSQDIPSAVCTCAVLSDRDDEDVDPPTRQARKLRRTRRIDPQLILIEDEADEDEAAEKEAEMARQRRLYETAFDCKVNRSDDDLDDLDRVTNHPVLHSHSRVASSPPAVENFDEFQPVNPAEGKGSVYSSKERRKVVLLRPKPIPSRLQQPDNISSLSQELESIHVNSSDEKNSSPRLPLRGYQPAPPSPPSTAPLPAKFHGRKDHLLLNIRSAPNLPAQTDHPRLKDTRLPVKSLRAKESPQSSEGSILEIKGRPKTETPDTQERRLDKELILEFKGRPKEERQRPRSLIRETRPIMEFKGRPHEAEGHLPRPRRETGLLEFKLRTTRRRVGYSSTESMATSSSGGSMESLRSSTSEGNRSTSSSESRHSTSLSSHSSDSGSTSCVNNHQNTLSGFLTHHANKLHILSPISDKSSQEPASETSDNNRNNNSQKGSPEEVQNTENTTGNVNNVTSPTDTSFKKRRTPQNKNLINLALQSSSSGDAEIQGSDSGISIESRAGIKCKPFGFHLLKPQLDNLNLIDNEPELNDLPFDMPKLRRRRLLLQQDATTSGSATSVDLRDLPFDMPKLRRRLRCTQSVESSASQASSSLSVRDVDVPALFGGSTSRPKMTLNLDSNGDGTGIKIGIKKPGGLCLGLLPLEISTSRASADLVDADLPLERQGWYHGSITRIEAEAVLRLLREGSYLVRNSESTKQDYSLSLKSARGFMHMRIQRNEELNAYILGQFSKPFETIPEMVRHFSVNRLPIRGAEHMCLLHPVIAQLL